MVIDWKIDYCIFEENLFGVAKIKCRWWIAFDKFAVAGLFRRRCGNVFALAVIKNHIVKSYINYIPDPAGGNH